MRLIRKLEMRFERNERKKNCLMIFEMFVTTNTIVFNSKDTNIYNLIMRVFRLLLLRN